MQSFFFRCEHLLVRNEQLRQQLEESHRTNVALTHDLQKLGSDWEHLRNEMEHKEDEWKEEEQVITNCFTYNFPLPANSALTCYFKRNIDFGTFLCVFFSSFLHRHLTITTVQSRIE